jgi:mannitol/fructose-specific phosphotransferase system IIA component
LLLPDVYLIQFAFVIIFLTNATLLLALISCEHHHLILLTDCTYKNKEPEKIKKITKVKRKNGMKKIEIEKTGDS